MTDKYRGVTTKVESIDENFSYNHCGIHGEDFAVKLMHEQVKHDLQKAVKAIKFVKSPTLNDRLFSKLCSEKKSEYI